MLNYLLSLVVNIVGEVMYLNKYKIEKQYQQTASMSINLALENVDRRKVKRDIEKEMIKGYMALLSK